MNRITPTFVVPLLLLGAWPAIAQVSPEATLAGVVRDVHGTPQLGALVELLAPDTSTVARAFTDDHGRYLFGGVLPGSYQVRASAAFLTPVLQRNLHLKSGVRVVADLTMTALFEAGSWLPTEKRNVSTSAEDWRWTLRSTANRPLLRFMPDVVRTSSAESSSSNDRARPTYSGGQLAFLAGDGSFGEGGNRQVLTVGRAMAGGDMSVLKADLGNSTAGAGSSVIVGVGLEHARAWGGDTRVFASFASHPELETANGAGLQVLQTAATESLALGDAVMIDAGTLFTAERLLGTAMSSAPYVRIGYKPSPEMVIEYRLATSRDLQQSADLDDASLAEELMTGNDGRPVCSRGLHQELAVERKDSRRAITAAVYRDSSEVRQIQGGGALSHQSLATLPVLFDPVTETLQVAANSAPMSGVNLAWTEVLTSSLSASVEGQVGSALSLPNHRTSLAEVPDQLHTHAEGAVSGKVQVKAARTGTYAEAIYRWQPAHTLTQVDAYDVSRDEAYLSFRFRQRLWVGRRLKGLNAVAEATNLLSQGYEPVLGPDGQTLFLAQAPRTLQAGLAFSF